jgi:hypothetical protein
VKGRFCFIVGLVLLAWLLTQAAAAQSANYSQQFYGIWYTYPLGNPNTDPIRHEFRHNAGTGKDEMLVTRICPGDYRSVTAKAVSPIQISEDTIQVLKSASDTREGEGSTVCRASIEAGTWSYSFTEDGARMTITNPGGNPDILVLARQDAVTESLLQSRVYGTWLLPAEDARGIRVETRLVFYRGTDPKQGSLRQIVSCSSGDDSLLSQADSTISVDKDQITVLESASHQESDGPFVCTATITAATLHYSISPDGTIMTLSKPGQKPLVLTRER